MRLIHLLKSIYLNFFNWCLSPLKRSDKIHRFRVHVLIATTLITGILMWSYAFTAYHYIDHPSIKYMGFFYAGIHLLNILCYKWTGSIERATYMMLIPGGLFQMHFSLLSGGFLNPILMWIAILPVIAGVLTDKKHTIIWITLILIAATTIFIMDLGFGYFRKDYLNQSGLIITQTLTVFGMMILHSGFTLFLLKLKEVSEEQIRNRALSKQNLLRVLAHDVSTPLTLIQNNTLFLEKILEKDKFDDLDKKKLKNKVNSTFKYSQKICNLIHAIREMEAFESGKKVLQLEEISLKTCVEESIEMLRQTLSKKRITIHTIIDDIYILGNRSIIEHQIISNIISNSIKFSPEDSEIFIHTSLADAHVELFIKDRGIGIPDYLLSKVFDPIANTNRQGTSGEEGTGFGMPIAKRSIELLGGEISIESHSIEDSPKSHGSVFKLSFQISRAQTLRDLA
ncbi:HAMP domain-containing sensor histidine kinase [Halobacteriovorax sp. JY17]|uniref:sensor histidine kinase n=1 Tax=Halobacteriovorax sp. JY17 TaxID=2014617 RepID=UPI000C3BD31F|nr:HAMP domain-containing sensor histidine kinase [Halobacteriovorax sp. JY17]PIK13744.1 MAG: hypothetical protein CES88_16265 [Halobacteriovorax sp. JY17]